MISRAFTDLIHAARTLVKARSFTAVCVTSLGIGMGVVILIMTFTGALLGTPAGVNDDGLIEVVVRPQGALRAEADNAIIDTFSYPDYLDVRDALDGMATSGWNRGETTFRPDAGIPAYSQRAMFVSSNYFSTIGVVLPLGPGFTAADDASVARAEAVISHRMWQLRFGGDPGIIGRTVLIDRTEHVVVGVPRSGFADTSAG